MSLPWFGFNIKDFIANTVRLDTEAKGAYLMLLLDYYQQEEGPPDVAKVLATITGLSLDRWLEHAPVILPLFEIRAGRLWHGRVEEEIIDGKEKYAQRVKASGKAASARALRRVGIRPDIHLVSDPVTDPASEAYTGRTTVRSTPGAPKKPTKKVISTDPVIDPVSDPVQKDRHDTESVTEPVSGPVSDPMPDPATQEQEHILEGESAYALSGAQVFPAPLDPAFKLTGADMIRCQNDGANSIQISAIFDGWKAYSLAAGTLSDDWPGSWWRRWERDKPVTPPKPKPRIEVSRKAKGKPLPEGWEPNDLHITRAEERGITGRAFDDLVETFRDYCAQAANRTKYSDHDAAFRTFIKNQSSFHRGSNGQTASRRAPPPSRGSITGAADEALSALDRAIEASESGDGVREKAVPALSDQRLRQPEGGAGGDGDGA